MRRLMSVSTLIAVLLIAPTGPPGPVKTCTAVERATIGCSSSNGTSVTVAGARSTPQLPGSSNPGGSGNPGVAAPADEGPSAYERCLADAGRPRACLDARPPRSDEAPVADAPAAPALTITDLARFSPAPATAVGEPSNLGVVGLPMNFVATASAQTRTGTLLDAPISVRFTPVGFDFRYGDGVTATLSAGGDTWAALGQAEFTPTATGHVYRDRGTFDADVTVRYTAEVDLGAGWMPVDGELSVPGPAQRIRIYEAHTALVAYTCAERPTAQGC